MMGDLGRKRAKEVFSWETVAEEYLRMLEQAANGTA